MEQNIHYDILSAIAKDVLNELYSEVQKFPEMMVCDWRAYAVLEAYRQYFYLFDDAVIPTIEDCFSGVVVPPEVLVTKVWVELSKLHNFHWKRYSEGEDPDIYEALLSMESLPLKTYTLRL